MEGKGQKQVMEKIPWGIASGICVIAVFWLTAAVIAAYIILNAVAGSTNSSIGLLEDWWQALLFVLDIIFGIIFIGTTVMYVLVHIGVFKRKNIREAG